MTDDRQWWRWVQRLLDANGWTLADLSRASGVHLSVIGRWESDSAIPHPPTARKIAHAFRRPVREAAIAAGHYTPEELGADLGPLDLSSVSNEVLRDEVYGRMAYHPPRPGPKGPTGKTTRKPRDAATDSSAVEVTGAEPDRAPIGAVNPTFRQPTQPDTR